MEGARASLGKPMEWRVSQYPQLSAHTVEFANTLTRKASSHLEFTSGGQPYTLSPDTTVPSSAEFPATVQCSINGRSMHFGFDSGLCAFLLSDWLPLEDVAALPDNLKKSVMIAVLNPIADFFSQHSAGSFNVEDIECQSAHPPSSSLFFNLSSANGVVIGRIFADVDEQTTDILHKIWQATAKPAPLGNTEELPVWVDVVAASTRLSMNEFSELREDDIILLDVAFSELKEVYARISDSICFSSVIDGNKLIIQKPGGVVMASDTQPPIDQDIEERAIDDEEIASGEDQMPFSNEDEPDEESLDEFSMDAEQSDGEPLDEFSMDSEHSNGEPLDEFSAGIEHPDEESTDTRPSSDTSPARSERANGKQPVSQLNDLGELPVELLFVVDQFKTTIKEVERIKPGYVFELNHKAVGQAEIRANGTLIGIGEMVQIDDRAGVRVIKLYGQTNTKK